MTDEVRISIDIRYQRESDVIEMGALGNHAHRSWPEIYANWSDEDRPLMNYWQTRPLTFSARDDSLLEPGAPRPC